MTELIFGIVWLLFVIPMSIAVIISAPSMIIFFSIFYVVGIYLVVKGAKRVIADKKTEKNGEICYGRIKDILATGTSVNGRSQLKATVSFFIPSLNKTETLDEVIGFGYGNYHEGAYVKLKFYNNDINILGKVEKNEVPQNVLNMFDNSDEFIMYASQSGERLQPMNMPANGTAYEWNNKDNNQNYGG